MTVFVNQCNAVNDVYFSRVVPQEKVQNSDTPQDWSQLVSFDIQHIFIFVYAVINYDKVKAKFDVEIHFAEK